MPEDTLTKQRLDTLTPRDKVLPQVTGVNDKNLIFGIISKYPSKNSKQFCTFIFDVHQVFPCQPS